MKINMNDIRDLRDDMTKAVDAHVEAVTNSTIQEPGKSSLIDNLRIATNSRIQRLHMKEARSHLQAAGVDVSDLQNMPS